MFCRFSFEVEDLLKRGFLANAHFVDDLLKKTQLCKLVG